MTSMQKGLACGLNNVGMAIGVKLIAQYEGTGTLFYNDNNFFGKGRTLFYNDDDDIFFGRDQIICSDC